MVEFDLRVTPTGQPVLHHDRLAGRSTRPTTLIEALKFVDGRVPLYIEVKPGEDIEPIAQLLGKYKGRYYLASKSQKTLLALHRALPQIPKIVIEPWSSIRARLRAKQLDTNLISMNQRFLWPGFIKFISKKYELYSYTINSPAKARQWQKYGLAGLVTDRPDLFKNL